MNLKDINESIYELENGATSYDSCHKLASLYVVKDHLEPTPVIKPAPVIDSGYSQKNFTPPVERDKVMEIFNELLETVKITQPRLYDCVMRKLEEIS